MAQVSIVFSRGGARRWIAAVALCLLTALATLCPLPAAASPTNARIVELARKQIGNAYTWGGLSPEYGFDCAGLASWAYAEAGIDLGTRYLPALAESGPAVEPEELIAGDLVFFQHTYKWGLSHVGIYSGEGRFVHAAGEQYGIIESDLARPYWQQHWAGAVRAWEGR